MKTVAISTTITALTLIRCRSAGSDEEAYLALWKQCRPLYSTADLQCWYVGRGQPISQCKFANEEPAGCIGEAAAAYYNAGKFDMSDQFQAVVDGYRIDRPKWVQFKVASDGHGGYGQRRWRYGEETPYIVYEKVWTWRTAIQSPVTVSDGG